MKRIYLILLVVLMGAWTTQAQKNIPTTAWTGTASTMWSAAYVPGNAIDGDTATFWITENGLPGPHWISFDLGKAYDIEGFRYTRRAGGTPGATGTLKNGTIYQWMLQTSADGTAWSTAAAGTWTWDTWAEMDPKVELTGTKTGVRYVRLNSVTGMNDYGSCAEFDVLVTKIGADFEADNTKTDLNAQVIFTDKSDDDPTEWAWVFEGGTPATHTKRNPVVTYANDGTYDVTLTVTYGDASTSTITFTDYITAAKVWKKVPKGAWTAAVSSFQAAGSNAAKAIDGDVSTIWHSEWAITTYPHWIVVDMGKKYDLEGFAYTPRSGPGNGTFKDWLFEVSADSANWDILGAGVWTWDNDDPKEELTGTQSGIRYMRLTTQDAINNNGTCAEFDALVGYIGASFSVDNTSVYLGSSATFTDGSDNNPVQWAWTFEGGTPASSTKMNPVVAYNTMGMFDVSLTVTYADKTTSTTTITDYIDVTKQIPSTNWEAIYADSEETQYGGEKEYAIDGDESTIWHTCWSDCDPQPDYPHWIAVDMGADYEVESFIFVGRDTNGGPVKADFYVVSTWPDRNDTTFWMDPASWGTPAVTDAAFDWSTASQWQIDLPTPATGRYFVFYTTEENDGQPFAVARELYIIGTPAGATRIQKNSLNADVAIYPNPARGNFTVEVEEANATIKVYNATGTLVYEKRGASTTEQIDISSRGVYLIQIELNGATTTRKLIIR